MIRTKIWIFTEILKTSHTIIVIKILYMCRTRRRSNDEKEYKAVSSIPVTLVGNKTTKDAGSQLKLKLLTQLI